MPLILGALFWLGVIAVAQHTARHLRGEYGSSQQKAVKAREAETGKSPLPAKEHRAVIREHRHGWWAREVGGGFPLFRTSFWTHWTAHRAAVAQERGHLEEARNNHLEQELSFHKARKRVTANRKALEAELAETLAADPPDKPTLKAVREKAGAKILQFRQRGEVPAGDDAEPSPAGEPATLPACATCGEPLRLRAHDGKYHVDCEPDLAVNESQQRRDREGMRGICAACGHPQSGEDPLVVDRFGYRVHKSHTTDPESGLYEPDVTPQPATTTGGNSMSEMGYRQMVATSQAQASAAEQHAVTFEQMAQAVENMADSAHGDDMDGGTLADLAELAAKYRNASVAAQACFEGSTNFSSALQQRHGGLAEAHENAPVDHAAKREFYEAGV